jgi:hypothetical protein
VTATVFNQALEALVEVGRVRKTTRSGKRKDITFFALTEDEMSEF